MSSASKNLAGGKYWGQRAMTPSLSDITSSVCRASVEFVTFYVALRADENVHPNQSLSHAEQMRNIRLMFQSAKLFHPKASTTLLTDARTRSAGISFRCKRVINEVNPKNLMFERATAQQHYLLRSDFSTPMVLLDSDILLNRSLGHVFQQPFDVALTWRAHAEMSINGGILILNNQRPERTKEFFSRFVRLYHDRYADKADWFGDQLALRDYLGVSHEQMTECEVVDVEGCRVLLLPCSTYNFSPKNRYRSIAAHLPDKVVLHFKGERKRLMAPYWKAWVRPAHSFLPWVQLVGWLQRRWLARECERERVAASRLMETSA